MATLQLPYPTPERAHPTLHPGPEWASFEQFRIAGSPGLEALAAGQVGTLRTKAGIFRLVRDEDFQHLVGMATEADRLKVGLGTIMRAVKVMRDHPESDSAVELLLHLAAQYSAGFLSTKQVEPLAPPTLVPEDDEVITDPIELQKRVAKR